MLPAYEEMLEQVYRSILKPGDTAIDVGAHTGRHTVPIANAVGPTGKVFSFEPLPFAHQALAKRLEETRTTTVTLHNFALGEDEGETEFTLVPEFPEYSGFKERTYHSDTLRTEKIKVQVRRLDFFAAQVGNPRYIKIDAEGGELTILRSGRALIAASQPIVSFELGNASLINYPYAAGDYFDFFAGLGYRVFSLFGLPLNREQFVKMAEQQFFWDYVAIPAAEPWVFTHEHLQVMVQQLGAVDEHIRARAHAEARLSEVTHSRSWRLTEPLRRVKTAVGRALKGP